MSLDSDTSFVSLEEICHFHLQLVVAATSLSQEGRTGRWLELQGLVEQIPLALPAPVGRRRWGHRKHIESSSASRTDLL